MKIEIDNMSDGDKCYREKESREKASGMGHY